MLWYIPHYEGLSIKANSLGQELGIDMSFVYSLVMIYSHTVQMYKTNTQVSRPLPLDYFLTIWFWKDLKKYLDSILEDLFGPN